MRIDGARGRTEVSAWSGALVAVCCLCRVRACWWVPKWGSVRERSAASEGAGCQRSVLSVAKKAYLCFQIKGVFVTISVCGEQRRWSADVSRDEGEGRTESNPLSGITCGLPAGSCGVLTAWRQRSPALMAGFRWRWFQRGCSARAVRPQGRQIASRGQVLDGCGCLSCWRLHR